MARRKTVEELRAALEGRDIELFEYSGYTTKHSKFRCLADGCGHEWAATTDNVVRGKRGCPKCAAAGRRWTKVELAAEFQGRGLEILEYLPNDGGTKAMLTLRCTAEGCGHEWEAGLQPTQKGQGCRECWKRERGLTEKQVRENLGARDIELDGPVAGTGDPHNFVCLKDGHRWTTNLGDVLRGQGCKKCAGLVTLTADNVRERLAGRDIELVEYAGTGSDKSTFRCKVDGHTWVTTSNSVLAGSGCPVCAGNKAYSFEEAYAVAEKKGCELLVYGFGVNRTSLFRCHVDGYEWESTLANVRSAESTCPRCTNRGYMTKERFNDALSGRNIEVVEFGGSLSKRSTFRCKVDGHMWSVVGSQVLAGTGCAMCAGHLPLSVDDVEYRIHGRPISLVSYAGTAGGSSVWQCHKCGGHWTAPAERVAMPGGTGCPTCAAYGFSPGKPGTFYIYKFVREGRTFLGFGITNDLWQRDRAHQNSFAEGGAEGDLVFSHEGPGWVVKKVEDSLKYSLPIVSSGIDGFKREAVLWDEATFLSIKSQVRVAVETATRVKPEAEKSTQSR